MTREFAGYVLEESAFADAVSSIWHGHSARRPGRRVTVRVFNLPEDGGLAGAMYAFREDAEAAMRLTDERIVATDDIARREGHTYVVSPYVPAIPLSHHLQGGVPGPERALALLGPLADALDAAARNDLAHGAIHPHTIWTTSEPEGAVLSGFGLHHLLRVLAVQRRGAEVVDDFLYVAPELLKGGRPTNRSDQYALAAAFLHTMAGRPPFDGDHLAALFGAHLFGLPPVVELDDHAAAHALDAILERALAKNPDKRFERCRDFVDAVAEWQHQFRTAPALPADSADHATEDPGVTGDETPVHEPAEPPHEPAQPVREPAPSGSASVPAQRRGASIRGPASLDNKPGLRRHPRAVLRARRTPLLAAAGAVIGIIVALALLTRGPSPEPDEAVAAQVPATQAPSEPPGVRGRQRLDAPVSNLYVTSSGIVAVTGGIVAVLDPGTGDLRGRFDGGRSSAVVTGDGGLLTADEEGLTARDLADGSVAWRSDLAGAGPPTVVGETVYGIADAEVPQLVATDAGTGQQLWQFPGEGAERAFPAETAVAPADDFVYLADSEAVYGILPKGASVGTDTAVIDADEPAPEPLCVWKTEVDDDLWLPTLQAVSDGVVVADRSGNVCLRGFADGEAVWCVAVDGVADAQPTLLPSGDHVFVVTQTEVTAIDIGTGKQAWTQEGRYRDALFDGRGQLILVDEDGMVNVVSAEGDVRKLNIDVALPAVLAIDGDVLYAAEKGGGVVSADLTQAGG